MVLVNISCTHAPLHSETQSTKYINRIIKLSSLIRKLLDNASPVLKTTVLLIFTHFTTWQKPQPTHFYPLFQTQIRDTTSP